jgi:hypothetical protein
MEMNMKSMIQIGLIIVAVMFVMKMMKGKRSYEGFSEEPSKVECNCNMNKVYENFAGHEKLNKVKDLNEFKPPNNILYINTLPKPYHGCNLIKDENGNALTINKFSEIFPSEHCALYCAHKDCGSAMRFYNKNKNEIHLNCKNIYYIKGGAKDLLKDNRFEMQDKEACDHKINNKN